MGHVGFLTVLLTYLVRRSPFFESRAGTVLYLLLTAIAVVLWLGFELQSRFGWPSAPKTGAR